MNYDEKEDRQKITTNVKNIYYQHNRFIVKVKVNDKSKSFGSYSSLMEAEDRSIEVANELSRDPFYKGDKVKELRWNPTTAGSFLANCTILDGHQGKFVLRWINMKDEHFEDIADAFKAFVGRIKNMYPHMLDSVSNHILTQMIKG